MREKTILLYFDGDADFKADIEAVPVSGDTLSMTEYFAAQRITFAKPEVDEMLQFARDFRARHGKIMSLLRQQAAQAAIGDTSAYETALLDAVTALNTQYIDTEIGDLEAAQRAAALRAAGGLRAVLNA